MQSNSHKVTLQPIETIESVQVLYERFMAAKSLTNVTLDASRIERITTPCIQLLLAFVRTVNQSKAQCAIVQPSAAFIAACSDLGIADEFKTLTIQEQAA